MTALNESDNDKRFSDESIWVKELSESPKSASKALQAYIENFEGETTPKATPNGCYAGSTVSSLLSSKPKDASSLGTLTISAESSGDMIDNLIEWVNASYAKDLRRRVVPYGSSSTSSIPKLRLSELEDSDSNHDNDDRRSVWSDPGLSSLPSPGNSIVSDLESNVGSVSTDKLLQSFYKKKNSMQRIAPVIKNYPSWVDDLTAPGDYPSWVDDIDKTQLTNLDSLDSSPKNQRSRLSRSLSPSFFRRNPDVLSTSYHNKGQEKNKKSHKDKNDVWEVESMDTEVLISQPIYGRFPVNMGGALHSSLYRDKNIQQLCEQSSRKIGKRSHQSPTKERSSTKPHRRNVKYFPASESQRTTHIEKVNHHAESISSSPGNTDPRSKKREAFLRSTSRREPSSGTENLKLLLEERKESVDSNDTDRLMRLSPTGIHMSKRVDDQSPKPQRTSTSSPRISQRKFSEKSKSSQNLTREIPTDSPAYRRQASEKLTKLIESSEKDSYKHGSVTKKRVVRNGSSVPVTSNRKSRLNKRNVVEENSSHREDPAKKYLSGTYPQALAYTAHRTPKSAPRMRTVSVPDLLTERLEYLSLTDRRVPRGSESRRNRLVPKRTPPGYQTNNSYPRGERDEEMDSVDTESLVIHPPMPLFNASPSLTTETVSTVGSYESADTLLEQEALKTSFLVEGTGDETDLASSSATYMELVRSPRSWERNHVHNPEKRLSPKPGIITSFLEDCLSSHKSEEENHSTQSTGSPSEASERPVETLKKILFTVQSLTQPSEEEGYSETGGEKSETGSDTVTEGEEMFSDINSNDLPEGNNSLSRAYYHLSRLKKLVAVSQKVAGL